MAGTTPITISILFNEIKHIKVDIQMLEMPINLKVTELTAAQIKGMKSEEIISILTGEKDLGGILPLPLQQTLSNEILARSIHSSTKPHWSVTYNFWATVIAAVASGAAVYLAIYPPRASQAAPEGNKSVSATPSVENPEFSTCNKLNLRPNIPPIIQKK